MTKKGEKNILRLTEHALKALFQMGHVTKFLSYSHFFVQQLTPTRNENELYFWESKYKALMKVYLVLNYNYKQFFFVIIKI